MSSTRDGFQRVWDVYLPITAGAAAIVIALLVFAALRYRRKPGDPVPPERPDRFLLEAVYALALAAIAGLLLYQTFSYDDDAFARRRALEVGVVGFKWQWRFDYPGGASVVGTNRRPAQLRVPAGRPVRFRVRSQDVVHAFWVPALRFKRDAYPGAPNVFTLVFDRRGSYPGRCAEFCGLRHADMVFDVIVMEPRAFERWLAAHRGRTA